MGDGVSGRHGADHRRRSTRRRSTRRSRWASSQCCCGAGATAGGRARCSAYLVLAGAERFLVEFVRRNDDVFLGLTQPQLLSIVMMAGGGIMLWALSRRAVPAPRAAGRRVACDKLRDRCTPGLLGRGRRAERRRLRRPRAGARVRHARLRRRRGGSARSGARVHGGAGGSARRPGRGGVRVEGVPCTAVLRVFADEGLGCDVASGGELHLALRAGFAPERLYLHGNAKSEAELALALEAGVGTVVLDNEQEADRLAALGGGPRVLLRVVPGVDADTHEHILTGQAGSKFGMPPDVARALAERIEVAGLHMHIGSQLRSLEPYRRAVAALAGVGDFDVYDLGGGLAVRTSRASEAPGPREWVRTVVAAAHEELGAGKSLVLEPGRALVANAGVTLYRVESVKPGSPASGSSRSTAACPTICGRCSMAPRTAQRSRDGWARAATSAPWSASTASPATCSCATCSCPTRGPATCW